MNYYQQQILKSIRENDIPLYIYIRIRQSKSFIEKYYNHSINLDAIASAAHFSKFHFVRTFKNIYGVTPYQFLRDLRIQNAKKLLRKSNTISSVCYDVGYESLSTFSGLFKKATGLSPIAYKTQFKQYDQKLPSNKKSNSLFHACRTSANEMWSSK